MGIHLLKMIWNRKRANGLIIVEVAIAFVVVFALAVFAIRNLSLYQIPLGFNYDNMWRVQILPSSSWTKDDDASVVQIYNAVSQLPEVETINLMANPTFRNWTSTTTGTVDGNIEIYYINRFDDSAPQNFGMTLIEGRWFSEQDSEQNYDAVIVNQEFAQRFFDTESAIGKNIAVDMSSLSASAEQLGITADNREERVVGVFKDFRQFGELSPIIPYAIYREDRQSPNRITGLDLRLKPTITPDFEEKLITILKQLAPQYNYSFKSWSSNRESQLRQTTLPLTIFGIVASFLIMMVAMGLFGVLWQNVTSRTHEIGLRRALGASKASIHSQIISELLIVTLMGIAIAFIGLIQLPILGVFKELDWPLFWLSLASAVTFMLSLAVFCAFYPGKLATGFSPSQALHYE